MKIIGKPDPARFAFAAGHLCSIVPDLTPDALLAAVKAYEPTATAKPNAEPDSFLKLQEVAGEIRVTVRTLWSWRAAGLITFTRCGVRGWRIRRSEVQRFLAELNANGKG